MGFYENGVTPHWLSEARRCAAWLQSHDDFKKCPPEHKQPDAGGSLSRICSLPEVRAQITYQTAAYSFSVKPCTNEIVWIVCFQRLKALQGFPAVVKSNNGVKFSKLMLHQVILPAAKSLGNPIKMSMITASCQAPVFHKGVWLLGFLFHMNSCAFPSPSSLMAIFSFVVPSSAHSRS